jgi:hypothetical protein
MTVREAVLATLDGLDVDVHADDLAALRARPLGRIVELWMSRACG